MALGGVSWADRLQRLFGRGARKAAPQPPRAPDAEAAPPASPVYAGANKNILFHGHDHADVLRRIYERYCTDQDFRFASLIISEMIAAGTPFPYEDLGQYDAVVYSPIVDQAGYETSRLVDACLRQGVQVFAYPSLEWGGYFPGAKRGRFLNAEFWRYKAIEQLAAASDSVEHLLEEAASGPLSPETVLAELQMASETLAAHETETACDVRIAELIANRFRTQRLFLTPDRPAKAIYDHVVAAINATLRIPFDAVYFAATEEPRAGSMLPIHLRVAETLELEFEAAAYQDIQAEFGEQVLSYQDYMMICLGLGKQHRLYKARVLSALKRYPRHSDTLDRTDRLPLPAGTRLQAHCNPVPLAEHFELDINWMDTALRAQIIGWEHAYIYPPHWEDRTEA